MLDDVNITLSGDQPGLYALSGTVTLGAGTSVDITSATNLALSGNFINQGAFTVAGASDAGFVKQGVLTIGSGGQFESFAFSNATGASIVVENGGMLQLDQSYDNAGSIAVESAGSRPTLPRSEPSRPSPGSPSRLLPDGGRRGAGQRPTPRPALRSP